MKLFGTLEKVFIFGVPIYVMSKFAPLIFQQPVNILFSTKAGQIRTDTIIKSNCHELIETGIELSQIFESFEKCWYYFNRKFYYLINN